MDESITFNQIKGLSFKVYSPEEILKLSELEITNVEILDVLGNPVTGGLYDLRLGPNERDDVCGTCGLNSMSCAGHAGHINLPVPVFNPVFFTQLYQLLRGSCFSCHKLLAPPVAVHLTLYQLQALDHGLVGTVQDLAEVVTDTSQELESAGDNIWAVQTKLKRKYEQAIEGIDPSTKCCPVRSVIETRIHIVKNFIKNHMMGAKGKCPHCRSTVRKLTRYNLKIVYRDYENLADQPENIIGNHVTGSMVTKELTPLDAREHLHLLWENEKVFLQQLFKVLFHAVHWESPAIDIFIMTRIMVPPSRFRRLNVMKGRKYADIQTISFNEVQKDCQAIVRILKKCADMELDLSEKEAINKLPGKTDTEKLNNAYGLLQRHVYEIFDSDINKERNKTCKGIKQILEKKEGLFRSNMMGKRVNFAARSVISSDPYIMVNEIGLPLVFAKKLTFPEPVNYWNVEKLRRAVINGPNVHPGASIIEMEDGRRMRLDANDISKRRAMAKTLLTPSPSAKIIGAVKIVHRHVRNGDMLLLNRQPTLHKPSIMAHKAKVLPGEKTLRLHYANCKSYNADFDGDEMNAHLPQSYLGQAECHHIVGVNHQFLVPKDGTPLSGLIQDHIIAGVLLTVRGRFFNREQYHQLIYSAMSFHRKRLKLLPPTILKPVTLWSGKQVVSTIIINLIPEGKALLTVEGKAKVASKNWKMEPEREWIAGGTPLQGDAMSESEVIIRNGELLCGVIDKAHIGPTPYGMVHICYELYGGEISTLVLTALARLFTHYLQYYSGFSLGIEDIVVNRKPNRKRKRILRTGPERGLEATAKALDVDDPNNTEELLSKYRKTHYNRDDSGLKALDMEMKTVTHSLNNDINEVCLPSGLRKKFPQNNLQLMIESGAKGSSVNAMQISCLLGQIELEGRRMPLMLNGSTLPSFQPYDTSPAAGGFVSGRFMTGINPQEYFFHCMAGREGLIDTAVKTSRSGYLQRCLIKNLEGISVQYDHTVRDSDGTVIQFLYGEDGMDPMKMQFLKEKRLHALAVNYLSAVNERDIKTFKDHFTSDHLVKEKKKIKKWQKKNKHGPGSRISCIDSVDCHPLDLKKRLNEISMKKELIENERCKQKGKCPDPVTSTHRPHRTFGCVSENLDRLISEYVSQHPQHILWDQNIQKKRRTISSEQLQDMCYYKTLRSLAEPGETVGILAAQSIGEPSTQMTLNTFHFAGKGEMNVTLGIPRIREILMTASANIATPTMDLPLLDRPGAERKAERLKLKLNPAALKDILDSVKIKEFISIPNAGEGVNARNYIIRMSFLKHSDYKDFVNTSPPKVLAYIEEVFVKKLIENLKKKRKISSTYKLVDVLKDTAAFKGHAGGNEDEDAPPSAANGTKEEDGESSAESEGEGDTTSSKSKMRHDQEQSYEDPEEEEMLPESDAEADEEVAVKDEVQTDDEGPSFPQEESPKCQRDVKEIKHVVTADEKATRINSVKCIHEWVSGYDFDCIHQLWCQITLQICLDTKKIDMKSLLEEEINKANIHSVPHIKKAILVKDSKTDKLMIKTDGVNFLEAFKYVDILDVNKAYSNNIHEIANIYGIEAATQAIKREIVNVFAAYGIQVDPHHLSLVADYMTSSGRYRPCNRMGIEGHASPLQQMTFETTKNFMVDAMLMGVEDSMKSPSASIIVGQLPRCGTGSFSLIQKFSNDQRKKES